MFKYDDETGIAKAEELAFTAQSNYELEVDDYILFEVYTKDGERLIDPDFELARELGGNNMNQQNRRPERDYLILPDSTAELPMVGKVKLAGLTMNEAQILLKDLYAEFYNDPYVIVRYGNKRVVVLGGTNEGIVIPLQNENTTIVEVIALAGGIPRNNHSDNIRLIRGKEVFLVDLSTVEGYLSSNQVVESGDIIYIEPVPRVIAQSASEVSLIVSTITALTTLVLLFISL